MAGIVQVVLGALGVGRLMRFIPRTVMVGFIHALAILIFHAQLHHVVGKSWQVWAMVAAGVSMIYGLARVFKAVPTPLVALVTLTAATFALGLQLPTVGDVGELPTALPFFGAPAVPLSLATLAIVAPFALTLALIGLLESLLTAQLIDDITESRSDKDRESRGQGLANILTGFFGWMAGCAMIGQSMINVKSGGRTRLSTLSGGVFLLVLILVFGDLVAMIPMAALVAVMVVVAAATFDWTSLRWSSIRSTPKTETSVMAVTVGTVLITHNVAYGVLAGVVLAGIFFARRVAHVAAVTTCSIPRAASASTPSRANSSSLRPTSSSTPSTTRRTSHGSSSTSPTPTSGTRRRSRASTRSRAGSRHAASRPTSGGSTSTAGSSTRASPVNSPGTH